MDIVTESETTEQSGPKVDRLINKSQRKSQMQVPIEDVHSTSCESANRDFSQTHDIIEISWLNVFTHTFSSFLFWSSAWLLTSSGLGKYSTTPSKRSWTPCNKQALHHIRALSCNMFNNCDSKPKDCQIPSPRVENMCKICWLWSSLRMTAYTNSDNPVHMDMVRGKNQHQP